MFLYICVRFCVIFLMVSTNFKQLRVPLYENKSSTAATAQGQLCNNSAGCGNPAIKKDKEAINSFFKNEKIYNVTKILDDLLVNYDPIQRPNCLEPGKPPTVVFVDIYVRSMSRITELDMEYKFEVRAFISASFVIYEPIDQMFGHATVLFPAAMGGPAPFIQTRTFGADGQHQNAGTSLEARHVLCQLVFGQCK